MKGKGNWKGGDERGGKEGEETGRMEEGKGEEREVICVLYPLRAVRPTFLAFSLVESSVPLQAIRTEQI